MFIAMSLASAIGALVLIYGVRVVAKLIAGPSADPRAVASAAYIAAGAAAVPSFFIAVTFGGNMGGGWAETIAGTSAIPIGVAVGMFVVLVGLVIAASALVALITRAIRG